MKSFVFTMFLALALVISGTGCSKKGGKGSGKADSLRAAAEGTSGGKVLAKVDGTSVTQNDVAKQQDMLMQQLQGYADTTQIKSMLPNIRKQAFTNAINRVLLEEAIKRLNLTPTKEDVAARMDTYRKNFVSEDAFKAELTKRGMTMDQFQREVTVGIAAEKLFASRTAGLRPVSDQEIHQFYENNEQKFQKPERVRASHILLAINSNDTDAVKTQKRLQAMRILDELKKGANFAEEARKYSEDPSTKDQGGDLGYFERGRMVPEFEKAAWSLKAGELSKVVETPFGFHIIKVTDHAKAATVPFEQAKENISRYLNDQKRQQAIVAYFDSLRASSKIQYFDSSLVR